MWACMCKVEGDVGKLRLMEVLYRSCMIAIVCHYKALKESRPRLEDMFVCAPYMPRPTTYIYIRTINISLPYKIVMLTCMKQVQLSQGPVQTLITISFALVAISKSAQNMVVLYEYV